ncbi:hypothetical protein BH10BDE1_BH10BDE1_25900 [soil metagenome]
MGLSDSGQKRYIALFFAVLLGAVLPTACAPVQDETDPTAAGTVYRLPWLDSKGNYSLQDIPLSTFRNPDKLSGDSGVIIIDPKVSDGTVVGEEPIGRWIRDGSRMIPADFVTLQAATIYAHQEKLAEIDRATGVANVFKSRPRIGLLSRISEGPTAPLIYNNAIYDGRLDSLFVVPFDGQRLFISLNAGILGHEHFHRTFQAIILNPIREAARNGSIPYGWDDSIACMGGTEAATKGGPAPLDSGIGSLEGDQVVPMKVLNQVLIRGVNEGFADFWGWAYSRDEDFVGRSLGPAEDSLRRLDLSATTMPLKPLLRNSLLTTSKSGAPTLKSEGARVAIAYQFGTQYARILRGFVDVLVSEGHVDRDVAVSQVRQALASSLKDVSSDVLAKWGREELEPELLLKPMLSKLLVMSTSGPAVLDASASTVVCRELERLGASVNLKSGLCGTSTAVSLETTAAKPTLVPVRTGRH